MQSIHVPVMLPEVMYYLDCKPGNVYVDCTVGGAGHSKAILEKILPDGLLVGIDQDKDAIDRARVNLKPYGSNLHLFHGNFIQITEALSQKDIQLADGVLLDLGISLDQLRNSGRGFSFTKEEEPLDMRMNTESAATAEDIVNDSTESGLVEIFFKYGEERWARKIARKIVSARTRKRIHTSGELVQLVRAAVPAKGRYGKRIHPATRVFMSLRIAVNEELKRLEQFMNTAVDVLRPKGRVCVLSYHSLEDRIVKRGIRRLESECSCPPDFPQCVCGGKKEVVNLTRKAIRPGETEVERNPMARSARLRAAEKI